MKTVLIILPDSFSQRNFLESPLLEKLNSFSDIKIALVGHELKLPSLIFEKISGWPIVKNEALTLFDKLRRRLVNFLSATLEFRFNERAGFAHHRLKRQMNRQYIIDKKHDSFGFFTAWPWPGSCLIYNLIYRLYNANILIDRHAKKIFHLTKPDLVIVANCQKPLARNFVSLAKNQGLKVLGFVNSWDHLTTDGPVLKGLDEFITWNEKTIEELRTVQKINKPTHNIGPIQMDNNFTPSYLLTEADFKNYFKIDQTKKIVVFGVYNKRLGDHEVGLADFLTRKKILADKNAFLIIRGHPKDQSFAERYGRFLNFPDMALCQNGRLFTANWQQSMPDGRLLNSLLKNCALVMCGPTTLTLDALQFNKPVINLAFDGDLKLPAANSIKIRYAWDHYRPLLKYQAFHYVESYPELVSAITASLAEPEKLLANILKLKKDYLEPLDGRAAERLANLIKRA